MGSCVTHIVIPGPAEGRNPEFRYKHDDWFWIPGPLAALAPRNEEGPHR